MVSLCPFIFSKILMKQRWNNNLISVEEFYSSPETSNICGKRLPNPMEQASFAAGDCQTQWGAPRENQMRYSSNHYLLNNGSWLMGHGSWQWPSNGFSRPWPGHSGVGPVAQESPESRDREPWLPGSSSAHTWPEHGQAWPRSMRHECFTIEL